MSSNHCSKPGCKNTPTFKGKLVVPDPAALGLAYEVALCAEHWHEAVENLEGIFEADPWDLMAQRG